MAKRILKLNGKEAVIKIDGEAADSETIDLSVDLLLPSEEISGTPTVSIVSMFVTGAPTGYVTIGRGLDTALYNLQADSSASVMYQDFAGCVDATNEADDIDVTINTAPAELIIKLRKTGGYASKIETEQFSVYDDPDVVGS